MIYNDADHGCAVVMEVATGNIVAMANLTRKEVGNYIDADKNYAVSGCGSVEPGSTFKLASLLVAFDKGIATPNDLVDITGGRARFGNTILLDSEGHKNGIVTLQEAFEVSSNIGIAKAIVPKLESLKLQQEFLDGFRILGIDQPTDIDLLGEKKPRFKSTKDATWNRKVDMSRVLIGYSSEMTPLQVLTFYNAIANEGNMVKPRLVRKIMQYNNQVKAFETSYIKKNICSAQSLQQAKKLLLGVTSRGTGKSIQDSLKFKVAGKTGTTKLLVNGSYSDKYQASFVGYFPAEKPKYSVIVVVNNPSKGRVYGAQVAGPVFKEIAQKLYASKIATEEPKQLVAHDPGNFLSSKAGYRPMVETVFDHFGLLYHEGEMYEWGAYRSGNVYSFDKLKLNMAVMPNLNGMGLQDALYLLDRRRVRYKVSGRGKVIKQSVEPGTSIKEVSMVYLELG
jgi:cell division protein FtsI (penicillin-binding protein 3)